MIQQKLLALQNTIFALFLGAFSTNIMQEIGTRTDNSKCYEITHKEAETLIDKYAVMSLTKSINKIHANERIDVEEKLCHYFFPVMNCSPQYSEKIKRIPIAYSQEYKTKVLCNLQRLYTKIHPACSPVYTYSINFSISGVLEKKENNIPDIYKFFKIYFPLIQKSFPIYASFMTEIDNNDQCLLKPFLDDLYNDYKTNVTPEKQEFITFLKSHSIFNKNLSFNKNQPAPENSLNPSNKQSENLPIQNKSAESVTYISIWSKIWTFLFGTSAPNKRDDTLIANNHNSINNSPDAVNKVHENSLLMAYIKAFLKFLRVF